MSFSKDKVTLIYWTETAVYKNLRDDRIDTTVTRYKALINDIGFHLISRRHVSYIDTVVNLGDTLYVEREKFLLDTVYKGQYVVTDSSTYFSNNGHIQPVYHIKWGDTTKVSDLPYPFADGKRFRKGRDAFCVVNGQKRLCLVYKTTWEIENNSHRQSYTSIELVDKEYLVPVSVTTYYNPECLGCQLIQSTTICDSIVVR